MKKTWLYLFSLGALVAIAASLVAADKKPDPTVPQRELAEMKQQIADLQAKVQAQQQKMDNLEKLEKQKPPPVQSSAPVYVFPPAGPSGLTLPNHNSSISGSFADPNHPPKIWGEGECNGWKYYVIPLSCETTRN